MWRNNAKKAAVKDAVTKTVTSTLVSSYVSTKKTPDDFYKALLESNTTHFTPEELERLLAAFKRVTDDRLQASHFYEIVESEMGWSNLLLRKQLFKAFDFDGHGDINFTEFAEGYSTMLRGTVPEMLEFAWRLYHIQGTMDLLALTDVYTVLRLALAGLEEVRRMQGAFAGGSTEDTRFPERAARQILEHVVGDRQAPLTKEEFNHLLMRHRRLVECLMPGFELIPQDPLHRAAESGEVQEVQHLLEVDLLDVDGRDALAFPTTPLHLATKFGHADVTAVLLNKGANMRLHSVDGETSLEVAVKHGRIPVLELLLETGCDIVMPNREGQTAFHTAAFHGQYKALRLLVPYLELHATQLKDHQGTTPIHCCAATDQWQMIDVFIEYDRLRLSDIDALDHLGRTALHVAAHHKSFRVARKLLELGADVAATDYTNSSVLNTACCVPANEAVVNLLLSHEMCQVDRADDNGTTPVMSACKIQDIKTLRTLLAHHGDANLTEFGNLRTPLHAAVLARWLEGVDALLAPGVDCQILRDKDGCTPLDYARTQEIFELVRDYVENLYPVWTEDHPADFLFGMVFDEGKWKLQRDGELVGLYILVRPKVSKSVAAKRMEHKMIDRNSIKRQLRKAGLVVLEEQVRVQEYHVGVIKAHIRQYTLFRIGVPLYRLQQEAMKMRIQTKQPEIGKQEDFYIDEENYPNTGFLPLTLGERQNLLMNIIQSTPTNESLFIERGNKMRAEPYVAGISIAHYRKYKVISDFNVLHDPRKRHKLQQIWAFAHIFERSFWRRLISDYFSESKHNEFSNLVAVHQYFGVKMSFYFGFVAFFTNWLVAPALGGMFVFGMEFIPSGFESEIEDSPEDAAKFDDRYDHPLMFAYAFFLAIWMSFLVQGWSSKEKELAFRWDVDDHVPQHIPNPLSTAPVQLQFVHGSWQYRAVLTPQQQRTRLKFILLVSVPIELFFISLVLVQLTAMHFINDLIDKDCNLMDNCGLPNEKFNQLGEVAFQTFAAVQSLLIVVIYGCYELVAVYMTIKENHASTGAYEGALASRMIVFSLLNSYSTLFYYAYYKQDIDRTASMLSSLMVVGQILKMMKVYLLPYVSGMEPAENIMQRKIKEEQKKKGKNAKTTEENEEVAEDKEQEIRDEEVLGGDAEGDEEAEVDERLIRPVVPEDSSATSIYGNKPIADIHLPQQVVTDTFTQARDEVLNYNQQNVLEFAAIIIQFGYIAMFGAVWPLAALLALLNDFATQRLDMWKFCTFVRRPMAERKNGIGSFWFTALEGMSILGITNHMFMLAVSSNTMEEYFFPGITIWERMFAAFVAQNIFMVFYCAVRVAYRNHIPTWVLLKKKEPLRFIRDAYRAGCALRERRYRMLLANPNVSMKFVCKAEDIDQMAADRYLSIVRYVDVQESDVKRSLLYDSSTTIQALLTTVHLHIRGGKWHDLGEAPTAAGVLHELVPVTDVKKSYVLGKKLREAAYHIWDLHKDITIMGSKAATIMSIRQFACIDVGCTMPQAERYVRLVRYVESTGSNPWKRVGELQEQFPRGLMQVLGLAAEEGHQDTGEPVPSELGPLIEPVSSAKRAFEKADIVRRKMFERWVHDKDLQHSELVQGVCEDTGAFPGQLERYLLLKRYCDSMQEGKRKDLLQYAKTGTLKLCSDIHASVQEGGWRDPGEPSFYTYTPPIVVEED